MKQWLCMFLLVMGQSLFGQAEEDCIYLWNGFSQQWGYNHRINRLGDWVESPPGNCMGVLQHAAASGSGSDRAAYRSYATSVTARQVHFGPGSHDFILEGREDEWLEAIAEGSYFDPWIGNPDVSVEVLLNGFDLYPVAPAKADKLRALYLGVDTLWTDSATHTLHYRLRVRARLACSSLECEWFKNIVHYQVRLHHVAVVGPGFVRKRAEFDRHLSWTRDSLPDTTAIPASVLGHTGYPSAALGLRQLHFQLDRECHFLDWRSFVHPGAYDAAGGRYPFALGLHLAQWDPGQYAAFRDRYTGRLRPPATWAVQRRPGEAHLQMAVSLLQFADAEAKPLEFAGEINWSTRPGQQKAPTDSMATQEFIFFEF